MERPPVSRFWWTRDRLFWLRVLIVMLALFLSASTAPAAPLLVKEIDALAQHVFHTLTDPLDTSTPISDDSQ